MDVAQLLNGITPGWLKKAYRYFFDIPERVPIENYWFYTITNIAYILVALLHLSWFVVFFVMAKYTMMWAQPLSAAGYVVALYLNRRGRFVSGMIIVLAEVCLHQALAVIVLGWGLGFQNFIPLILLLPFVKYNEPWPSRFALGFGCLAVYLCIDKFLKNIPPLSPPDAAAASFLRISNAVLCFFLVALWGIVIALSYRRAVVALLKKEQELFAAQKEIEQVEILQQLELKDRDNEIYQLRNIELKNRNDEILAQTETIEKLIWEQEEIIHTRTGQLEEANAKLVAANTKLIELIQYNSHSLREPLTRVMGAMNIREYMEREEYDTDIWPEIQRAVNDLDIRIKAVINFAEESVKYHS